MTWFLPFVLAAASPAVPGQPEPPAKAETKPDAPAKPAVEAQAAAGVRHALIFCGHPGDAEHVKSFTATVKTLGNGMTKMLGIPAERQHIVFGADPPKDLPNATGPATRESVIAAIDEVKKVLRPEDGLWVVCLGHCHFDGRQAWWNLPGPDITATEFGKLFTDVTCREQVFVMTMSLSGYFVRPLARVNRVVIAATEADAETNETTFPSIFAQFLVADLTLDDHDVDKDGKLTLFDLYVVVAKEIAQNYASAEQVASEHPQLDDDGDGVGHELQNAFLPKELGGTASDKKKPRVTHRDGLLSARIVLSPKP
jgi:hypothetical protein